MSADPVARADIVKRLGSTVLVCAWAALAASTAGARTPYTDSIALDYGDNVLGNSVGLTYQHRIGQRLFWGMRLGRGQAAFLHKAHEYLILGLEYNGTDIDFHEARELKMIADFFLSMRTGNDTGVSWFSAFDLGLTHYVVELRQRYEVSGYPGVFRSETDFSDFALFLSCTVLEFAPSAAPGFSYGLGGRLWLLPFENPVYVTGDNGLGQTYKIYDGRPGKGGYIVIPYGELFFRVAWVF